RARWDVQAQCLRGVQIRQARLALALAVTPVRRACRDQHLARRAAGRARPYQGAYSAPIAPRRNRQGDADAERGLAAQAIQIATFRAANVLQDLAALGGFDADQQW